MTLTRIQSGVDGVFGDLRDEGRLIAQTLEHAYTYLSPVIAPSGRGYAPKVPRGAYTCRRGMHRLHGMTEDFETFEVMGVPDCTGILFHWGNWNRDSDGCILLGAHVTRGTDGAKMITESRKTWEAFMAGLIGVDEFPLTVM